MIGLLVGSERLLCLSSSVAIVGLSCLMLSFLSCMVADGELWMDSREKGLGRRKHGENNSRRTQKNHHDWSFHETEDLA